MTEQLTCRTGLVRLTYVDVMAVLNLAAEDGLKILELLLGTV